MTNSIEDCIRVLEEDIESKELSVANAKRRLTKLRNANTQLSEEPEVGTVLTFARTLAGGDKLYTFVAVRTEAGWTVSGKRNTLRLLGLSEGANEWVDLTVAIGPNSMWVPCRWVIASDSNVKEQWSDS